MHDYMGRNGVTEQTRWLRQQPQHLKYTPFDFEVREYDRNKVRREVFVVLFLTLLALVAVL